MGKAPTPKHTIDRIDNNGNYCKENCRWVSNKIQCNNKRNNKLVTYDGKTQTLSQWAEELGWDKQVLRRRLLSGKWSLDEAFTTPPSKSNKKNINTNPRTIYIEYNNETHSITEWAKIFNINRKTLSSRINDGWHIDEKLFQAPK
jgi:hypothetical protein